MNKNKSLYSKSAMCGYSYKDLLQFTPTLRSQHVPYINFAQTYNYNDVQHSFGHVDNPTTDN